MAEKDWYAELRLPPDASTEQIREAVERRSRQGAALANAAPERSQQLRDQVRAIKRDLLSGDDARQAYDAARQVDPNPTSPVQQAAEPAPFWTRAASDETLQYGYPGAQQQQEYPYSTEQQTYGQPDNVARRPGRFLRFLQSGWTCPACGEGALPSDQFCARCGARLKNGGTYRPVTGAVDHPDACPYCGTIATSNSRFCRICGATRPHQS